MGLSVSHNRPRLERAEVDMVVDIEIMGGAIHRGRVVAADDHEFTVEWMETWPGRRDKYPQGQPGVMKVSDG